MEEFSDLLTDGVVLRALMTADVYHVAETRAGDHPGDRPLALQHRVGGDGGAMEDVADTRRVDGVVPAEFEDARQHPLAGILRGGGHLVDPGGTPGGVGVHHVGEGTPHVNAYQLHARSPGQGLQAAH